MKSIKTLGWTNFFHSQKNSQSNNQGVKKMAQEYDLDDLYSQFQMPQKQKPVYVSVYEHSRAYGGPEEGGWWYDLYTLDSTKQFYDREEAEKFAEALRNGIENKGLNDEPISSSRGFDKYLDPSGGDPMYDHSDNDIPLGFSGAANNYRVIIEDTPGENETRSRPHYE